MLVLLVALAVVAYPRLSTTGVAEAAFEQRLLNALRYAHKQAMYSGCAIRVEVRAAPSNDYGVYLCAAFGGNPLPDPAGGVYAGNAPDGVTISSGLAFTFDGLGRPQPAGGSITFNGRRIVVESETGYVYAP